MPSFIPSFVSMKWSIGAFSIVSIDSIYSWLPCSSTTVCTYTNRAGFSSQEGSASRLHSSSCLFNVFIQKLRMYPSLQLTCLCISHSIPKSTKKKKTTAHSQAVPSITRNHYPHVSYQNARYLRFIEIGCFCLTLTLVP